MKRSPLRRKKPLRARKPPKRVRPITKVNRKRRQARSLEQYGTKEFREWIHGMPCIVSQPEREGDGPIEQVHPIQSRARGGTWRDTVPMRQRYHRELHDVGRRVFEAKYKMSLAFWVDVIRGLWEAEQRRLARR